MPDIAMDYTLLNDVAIKARSLKDQVNEARTGNPVTAEQIGPTDAYSAVRSFYWTWHSAFRRSEEKLESLAKLYEGVAKGWAKWDFNLAVEANKQAAAITAELWAVDKARYDQWQKLVAEGKVDPNDPDAPKDPGERPTTFTSQDGNGNSTTTTYTYGPDGKPTSITTQVTSASGLTTTETTNYRPDGSYDSTATDAAGNVTVSEGNVTTTESGNVKTTTNDFRSTTTDTDGEETVTTGKTTSNYDSSTGTRTSNSSYTTTGPDENGDVRTVKGTVDSTVDARGNETTTTTEVKEDGSGTRTVKTPDGRTEKWVSDSADENTGWRLAP
ncbi:hypothetical protein AB0G74_05545 [Streptomyces sp. NPDC020875]|uniref:hypothetical protein n=1 Tax=Streptomyces sp. NPDC020875 TaxID=3154898 RepID=UPI0034110264